MYAAFQGGDLERSLSCFAEDVVADVTTRVDGGIGHGRAELAQLITQWTDMFEDWREEIESIQGHEERVCAIAVQRGRGKDSGLEIAARYAVLYEVRDGAITRMKLYGDPEEALQDLEAGPDASNRP